MGNWAIGVASLGWLERKAASALFATPPESSYEEALGFLLEADKNRAGWCRNAKLIGDVYVMLKDKPKAKEWYAKCAGMTPIAPAEKAAQAEAADLAKKL